MILVNCGRGYFFLPPIFYLIFISRPPICRLTLLVILSAVAIGLLLQGMLWRIEAVGFDWLAAILGLAAVGVLVMSSRGCTERGQDEKTRICYDLRLFAG